MSDQDYIYGVYADAGHVQAAVAKLHEAGLQTSEICVLGRKSDQFKTVAGKIEDPTAKYFIQFGIGGAIAGLIAGISVSLHIPGVNGFQLIVPLMGTVAGGACFPYFICQLATFLTSNKPQHWANVFEGSVEAGSVIIMAEPQSPAQRQSAMDILLAYNPIEMIFRRTPWGMTTVDTQAALTALPLAPAAVQDSSTHLEAEFESERERRLSTVA